MTLRETPILAGTMVRPALVARMRALVGWDRTLVGSARQLNRNLFQLIFGNGAALILSLVTTSYLARVLGQADLER